MTKSSLRNISLLVGSLAIFGFAARQAALPSVLAQNFEHLANAASLTVEFKIRVIGDAPVTYSLTAAKPNLYSLSGPDGYVQSNGTTIYTYTKSSNSYMESPATDDDFAKFLKRPEMFAWAPFFQKNAAEMVAGARAGSARNIEGSPANEVNVTMKQGGVHGTLFIDQKQGIPHGFDLNAGGKEYLALVSKVSVGSDAVPATQYAFIVPDGAKKVEAPKPDDATFAQVQQIMNSSCMPCHSSGQHSGGADLSSYAGISAKVMVGNGAGSRLVTILRTPGPGRMPAGRAPLPETQISLIQKWIDNGAKEN